MTAVGTSMSHDGSRYVNDATPLFIFDPATSKASIVPDVTPHFLVAFAKL